MITMYEIGIQTHFSAAHHLRGYDGSCAEFHGHNWGVEVYIQGSELDEQGLLVDFRDLKETVGAVVSEVDHRDLNSMAYFRGTNPTSENIARYLYTELTARLNNERCSVSRVLVRETPGTVASYSE